MLAGTIVFQLIPEVLLGFFDASEYMIEIGVPALRTISVCFVFAAYSIVSSSMFQALGNGVYSLIISVARQIVIIIPAAFIFAELFGLNMVWWAYPLAEIAALILCTIFLKRIFKEKLGNMPD